MGSIRALQNERKLCKLSIDYLIDASNMKPDELARIANLGARFPCQCRHTHSRCTLILEFDQSLSINSTSTNVKLLSTSKIRELICKQIEQLFSRVNHFILKGLQEKKRILIYGFELTPNSPLAVVAIQYLMLNEERLTLNDAVQVVNRLLSNMSKKNQQVPTMNKRFQDYLKQLNQKTQATNFVVSSIGGNGSSSGNGYRRSSQETSSETNEKAQNDGNDTSPISWTTTPVPIINDNSNQTHRFFTVRAAWDS